AYLNNQFNVDEYDAYCGVKAFDDTKAAMRTCGFSDEEMETCWKVLACILHLGNIEVSPDVTGEVAVIEEDDISLIHASKLLGTSKEKLIDVILYDIIKAGTDSVRTLNNVQKAKSLIDSFARNLYACLFDFIIDRLNEF